MDFLSSWLNSNPTSQSLV